MESNSREQNFWPGFVDALSNLVLTLVFVMVIFVLALFYLSSKVSQSKMETLCPDAKAELSKVKKELDETHKALQAALAQVKNQPTDVVNVKKVEVKKKNVVSTQTSSSGSSIVTRFSLGAAVLDDGAKEDLDKALAPFLAAGQPIKANLSAVPGPETYSEGKRLSYFRNIAIRNYLIGKGISVDNKESKILDHNSADPDDPDGRVMIQIQRVAK